MDILEALADLIPSERKTAVPSPPTLPAYLEHRLRQDWDFGAAVEDGFKRSGLVYRVIFQSAMAVASVPYFAQVKGSAGTWERDDSHPLSQLLAKPNNPQSGDQIIARAIAHLYLGGNGLVYKSLLGRKFPGAALPAIAELWNLQPSGISPVPDRETFISRYETDDGLKTWQPEEIFHLQFMDPENPYWGMSPTQAVAREIDAHVAAIDWNLSAFDSRLISSGVFTYKGEGQLSPQQYQEARRNVAEQHARGPGAPWVLGGDFAWQNNSQTAVEMDFVNGSAMLRENILSGLMMPPVMAGFFDQATLANANTSRRLYWVDYLIPVVIVPLCRALTRSLVPHFANPDRNDLRVWHDLSGVAALVEETKQKALTFSLLTRNGVPYNEASRRLDMDLDPQPEGDSPFGVAMLSRAVGAAEVGAPGEPGQAKLIRPQQKLLKAAPDIRQVKGVQAEAATARIRAILDRAERAIRQIWADALKAHRIDSQDARDAAVARDRDGLIAALRLGQLSQSLSAVTDPLRQVARDVAMDEAAEIARQAGISVADVPIPIGRLEVLADRRVEEMLRLVMDSTEGGVDKLLLRKDQGLSDELASEISVLLYSLSSNQADSVAKMALDLETTGRRSREEIANLAEIMAIAYARNRADFIAGFEASNTGHKIGQAEEWSEARAGGIFGRAVKTWVTGLDGKVCPRCIPLHGLTVPQELLYDPGGEAVDGPPLHGECRCGQIFTIEESVAA